MEQSAPTQLILNLAVRNQEAVNDAPSAFRKAA